MVYYLARHKILLFLIVFTFAITLISGYDYWRQWSILPIIFTIFYIMGKYLQLLVLTLFELRILRLMDL